MTEIWTEPNKARIRRSRTTPTDEPASWTRPEEHWSLGGQQEKFAMTWRAGSWHEAHGAGASTHVFKPGIRALHSQALVEYVTATPAEYESRGGPRLVDMMRLLRQQSAYPDAFAASLEQTRDAPGVDEVAESALPALKTHCDRVLEQL